MNNTVLLAFVFLELFLISGCGASVPAHKDEFHSAAVSPTYHPPTSRRKSISATGDQDVIDNRQLNMQIYNKSNYPIILGEFLTLGVGESVSLDKYASILAYFRIIKYKKHCDGPVDIYPNKYIMEITKCDYL